MKRYIFLVILLLSLFAGKVIAALPQGSLSANGPFCVSGAGQLKWTATEGVGPFTIVYNDGSSDYTVTGIISDVFFDIGSVTSTTTYTLVSVTDGGGTRTGGFTGGVATITIDPLPTASVTGSKTICEDGTATVSGGEASASNGTILWTENGAGSITAGETTLTPTYTAASGDAGNPVTLTMTVTSDNSCGTATASDTYTIDVEPLPTASVTGSQTICENGTATVGVGEASASDGTILWTENGAGLITSGATTLTPTYTAASGDAGNTVTLTMTVTSDNSCGTATASDTYTIDVEPLPTASVTGSQTICENGTATVGVGEASASDGTILWTENGAGLITSGATTLTPTYTAASGDAEYTVTLTMTVTSDNTCGTATASDTYTINVDALPTASVTGNQTICESGTATVGVGEASASDGTILWTENGAGSITSGETTLTPTYTAATGDGGNTVTLTMTVTSNNTCGSATASDTYAVNVNQLPTLTGASQAAAVCSGSTAIINLTGLLPGTTSTINYTIAGDAKDPVTGVVADGSGSASFTTAELTPDNNGKNLTITGITTTIPGPDCFKLFSQSLVLIVNTANVPAITGNFSPCIYSTGNIYTTDEDMTLYTWNVSAGGTITDGGGLTQNFVEVTWDTPGAQSVSVNYTNLNSCTAASPTTKTITVNPLPSPSITGPSPVCLNTGGHVYTTQADMTSYNWNISPGNIITTGGTGNMVIVTWNTEGAQSINVNYTDANGCIALTPGNKAITVNSLPVPTLNGPSPVCVNSTGNVYTTEPGMTNYIWTIPAGGTVTLGGGTTNNTVTVTWNTTGPKTISVKYTDTNGCTASAATEMTVTVNPLPVPSISGPTAVLVPSTHTYTTQAGMTNYNWSVSAGGTFTAGASPEIINVDWNTSGAQTVGVTYTNANSCTAAPPTLYNVTVNAVPVASGISIHGDPRSGLTLNASYVYSDSDTDPEGTSLYQWYTGTSSTGAESAPILLATATTYKLTDSELTKFIGFSVTPVAQTGSTPGNMAASIEWVGPVHNDSPVATVSPVTGTLDVDSLITGHYVYSDFEGDIESGTLYQWYSSDAAGGTYSIISGQTGIAHIITNIEQGKYFKIYITPKAASGSITGIQVQSPAYGPANTQPSASNVLISGTAEVDSTLYGSYTFTDVDAADTEGSSTFRWLRNGTTAIPGATNAEYVITAEDEGYRLSFEVTPVSASGYPDTGTPVQSAETIEVIDPSPLKPVASEVCIEGIRAAVQTLRGKYYYDFYKSEGTSLYQWFRDGEPISGATGIQYTLKQVEDIESNADITFKVTPKSSNDPPKVGTSVMSNPLARIMMTKDQYSVSEADDTIKVNVAGGVFSGTGVNGNIFSPSEAGSEGSPHTISYLLNISNPAHNCSQQASKQVIVNPNVSFFVGFDPLYCHDSGTDVITVSGVPTGSTDKKFTITDENGIIDTSGTMVTIDPGRMRPGFNQDVLYFSYNYDGIFYQISQSFNIDSVSTEIRILNLDTAYCQGDAKEYITIEGVYPSGGTAEWTDVILSDTKAASAYLDPSKGTPGTTYPVTYQYRSPSSCYSKILSDSVTINPLPVPLFPLNLTYNIDGGEVELIPVQTGGTFNGNGVSGDYLFPDIAGLGEHEIKYTITDANNCTASLGLKTRIRAAQGNFTDIPSVICYDDTTYNVKIINLPATGVTITGFTNFKNTLVYIPGDTVADYNVPEAGEGLDTLVFSYKWDGVDYSISKAINVDSLGQVVIGNLTVGEIICDHVAPYELFPSIPGGVFTGPVSGGYLDPLKATRSDTVTYTFTNTKTGCSTSTTVPITVYPSPKVAFLPADVCIENDSDTTIFINNTTPSDSIKSWYWVFTGGPQIATDSIKNGRYLSKTGGLRKIALTATTINECAVTKDTTLILGIRPDADFYWKNDCMHPGDSIILVDTTFSSSPIDSRSWRLLNGDEFSTAEKMALYPKTDTGYLSIQYIVRTPYLNCIDTVTKNVYIRPSITIPADGYIEDFEAGKGGWVKGGADINNWSFGTPDRLDIDTASSGLNAWFTKFDYAHPEVESSSIVSPCFDFSAAERPIIILRLWRRFEKERDGAVLQYKIGDSKEWQHIGTIGDGIEWFNSAVIRGAPGGSQLGWTTIGTPDNGWVNAIHTLDELKDQTDVKLRMAYGSDGSSNVRDGIAFDDIWIGDRNRNVLLEHFTNITDGSSSDADALVKIITDNKKEDVINIQYHTNFPGADPYFNDNPADASARILFYGLTRVPYTFIDGGTKTDFANIFDNHLVKIDSNDITKRSLIRSIFEISLAADTSRGILSVSGTITAIEDYDSDNLTLYIAVTEKENSDYTGANDETTFYNVFRKFIPDAGGISLQKTWTKDVPYTIPDQTWFIEKISKSSDIEVVAFIQNNITKELYQATSVVKQEISVGIEDLFGGKGNDFALYPNPAVNKLAIRFKEPLTHETDIRIYDFRGVVISSYKAGSGITEFFIDDLNLKGGIYLVRITAGAIDLGFKKLIVSGK